MYFLISFNLVSKPLNALAFSFTCVVNVLTVASFTSLNKCSTPIASGSLASIVHETCSYVFCSFCVIVPSSFTSNTARYARVGASSAVGDKFTITNTGSAQYFSNSSPISRSFSRIFGPVEYHPTTFSFAWIRECIRYICSAYAWSRNQIDASAGSSSKGTAKEDVTSNRPFVTDPSNTPTTRFRRWSSSSSSSSFVELPFLVKRPTTMMTLRCGCRCPRHTFASFYWY
mmetsp:Transcript_10198/g.29308  ORF Transcript_10198/g.29308 Transcript_10198/m.29308 type:complete len:229 (-) Transcript_10198:76-762(-)